MVALIAVVGVVRCFVSKMRNPLRSFDTIVNQHIYAALLVTYVVLPTVSSLQFRAMDCQTMPHDGSSFLRVDSAIDCNTPSYKFFSTVVALGIVLYQSIPLCWLVLLWRVRHDLNPPGQSEQSALLLRRKAHHLQALKFLFIDYLPGMYAFEVYMMELRIFFIGILPLLGTGITRSLIGIFGSAAQRASAISSELSRPFLGPLFLCFCISSKQIHLN